MVSRGAAASAALSRAQQRDTLGGVVARGVGPGAVAFGAGWLDGSKVGEMVNTWTGGWLDPSTALALAGGVARGFRLDSWIHPGLARANSTFLAGMIPVWLYKRGLGIPAIISGRLREGVTDMREVPRVSGAQPETRAAEPEPIPGEATVS